MDTAKIKELIHDLQQEILVREEALSSLQKLLASTNTRKPSAINITVSDNLVVNGSNLNRVLFGSNESYVDLAVKIIEVAGGQPLSVTSIVDQIKLLKGNQNLDRRSIEATLYQHVKKAESPRLFKPAPGIYGVRKSGDETAA
jgi:hypothetical protein